MAFSESELNRHLFALEERFWAHYRPPPHLRDQVREGQRIPGHGIEIFFVRPAFRSPGESVEHSIAKLKFDRSREVWAIYWMRVDAKWHRYPPCPEAPTLGKALDAVHADPNGCFFGRHFRASQESATRDDAPGCLPLKASGHGCGPFHLWAPNPGRPKP